MNLTTPERSASNTDREISFMSEHHYELEDSYERESRWKPQLSWSYSDWSLKQRMEEQAEQRESSWQKIQFLINNY